MKYPFLIGHLQHSRNAGPTKRAIIITLFLIDLLTTSPTSAAPAPFDLTAALTAAQSGATILVPPGVYPGPLQIDKPVILEGQGNPVIEGTGQGSVITVSAPDVTLRGFVIRNSGDSLDREDAGVTGLAPRLTLENNRLEDVLFGLYLKQAPGSVLRNNLVLSKDLEVGRRGDGIRLWYCAESLLEQNHVRGSRDVIVWFSPHTIIRDNLVEASRYGLHLMSTDEQMVERNILRHNSVGIYVMYGKGFTLRNNLLYNNRGPSGYGIGLKDVENFVAEGNRIVANRVGAYIDNAPQGEAVNVQFRQNLLAYNEIGLTLLPLVQNTLYVGNVFQENSEQIAISGAGQLHKNTWSQGGRGNFWSDYVGFDANGDHVGDLPYRAQSLFEDLLINHPDLRLFQRSPAAQALDLAARAFPIFQPQPKMADPHPLMAPPPLPAVPGLPAPPFWLNLAVAGGMIATALLVLRLGQRSVT